MVQGSHAVVTSTSGKRAPRSPRFSASPVPCSRLTGTIRRSTGRPDAAINSASGSITPAALSAGKSVSITTRIPASGNGSRRWCSVKGSSLASVVVMRTPGEAGLRGRGFSDTCRGGHRPRYSTLAADACYGRLYGRLRAKPDSATPYSRPMLVTGSLSLGICHLALILGDYRSFINPRLAAPLSPRSGSS